MPKNKHAKSMYPGRGQLLLLVVCLLFLYIVVPQIDGFSDSFAALTQARWLPVFLAVGIVVATYFVAAGIYQLLAVKKLRYGMTLTVQGASAFANRVLPAGLGGLTLNVQYLRHARHTVPQAVAVAGANNTLGFVGHVLLTFVVLLASGLRLGGSFVLPELGFGWYIGVAVGVLLLGVVLATQKVRKYLGQLIAGVLEVFVAYRKYPRRIVLALGLSICLTLLYVGVFYLSALAVGASLTPVQALIIFTLGIALGTATPTPGGLGGVEAGLMAGSVAYGETASVGLAAALLYRLLTYWLPLLPGFLLLLRVRKQILS